ncbi:MAG: mechanosensitive ion channel family protein [Hyphomonadaceae bacterium]
MHSEFEALWRIYGEKLIGAGLNLLAAATILIVGLALANWAGGAVRRLSKRHPRIDETLAAFFAWIVRYALAAIVLTAVLRRFGIETTSIVALFGAAALAIGLALQGTLSNLAAGVMLILFRPYRLGDVVELNGRAGVVNDINLFVTELIGPDHVKITLPNAQCWGAPILNFTALPQRRADADFAVPPSVPAALAIAAAQAALAAETRLEKSPAPAVLIKAVEHDKTIFSAQGWTAARQTGAVKAALLAAIRERLDHALAAQPPPP